jgi:hypothetical protein
VVIVASAANGWRFDHWEAEGMAAPAANPARIAVSADVTLTAVFVHITHALTLAVDGQGTLDPVAGVHEFAEGTAVTIAATPKSGWSLDHWEGLTDPDANQNPAALVLGGDMLVRAVFTPIRHWVTVGVSGQGTTDPAPASYQYNEGSPVTLSAQPANGWVFDHWDGAPQAQQTANPLTYTVPADAHLTAVFTQQAAAPTGCQGLPGAPASSKELAPMLLPAVFFWFRGRHLAP